MKSKKEIVQKLVGLYEYHVRMAKRCEEWAKAADSEGEKDIFIAAKYKETDAYLHLQMIMDECEIPYRESFMIAINHPNIQIVTH